MKALMVVASVVVIAACNSTTTPTIQAVPWLPLPRGNANIVLPSPTPPVPIPTGTPLCSGSQLEGRLLGAGTPVAFRNTGATACYVSGVPDITILDLQGNVLARGDGVGTQFDEYIAAVDVLMLPETTPLTEETFTGSGETLSPGQALLNIKWIGCAANPAAQLVVAMPGAAGTLAVDYPVPAPDESTCVYHSDELIRDPLKPTGVAWPPTPRRVSMSYKVDAPKTAKAGSTLEFFVTLANTSVDDYVLTPCPDYAEALVPGGPVTYYQLNCQPIGAAIKAGKAVTLQMKFAIPPGTPKGPWMLLFGLVDGRVTPTGAQAPITIT